MGSVTEKRKHKTDSQSRQYSANLIVSLFVNEL